MRKYTRFILAATAIAALAVPASSMASNASYVTCNNATQNDDAHETASMPAVITNNLMVPDGGICRLHGNEVTGNITVGSGATLSTFGFTADRNVTVNGGHFYASNWGGHIGGNLVISNSPDNGWIANGFWNDYAPLTIGGYLSYTNSGKLYSQGQPTTVQGKLMYSGNSQPYPGGLTVLGSSTIS
jgi:hypothetical protein